MGPRGQRDQRALRALWAKRPFGPLGPAYTQRKAIPHKIDICTLYPVPCTLYLLRWLKMKPGLDLQQMAQTALKCHRKDHSGRVLGHLARRLQMTTKAKSAANGPNCTEIPSKNPFWRGSGAPGQEAENDRQGQICSKWVELG